MAYSTQEGREQILDDSAAAARGLAAAATALTDAYELLDDDSAQRMETRLFKPLQTAYGQLQRVHKEFAGRVELPVVHTEPPPGAAGGARVLIERAADAIQGADDTLSELQDTLLPVEVGDRELRVGLAGVRTLIGPLPEACDQFIRTIGR